LMSYLTAARETVDAAVAYHGGDTEKYLDEADKITAPMLMHLAEEDEFISKEAQAKIKATLSDKPNVVIYSYPGCNHAFARHTGAHYNAAAAAKANGRTWQFLTDHLSSRPSAKGAFNSANLTWGPIREAAFASLKAPVQPVRAPVDPTDASGEGGASDR
jgi:hypothetical protein